MTTDTKQEQVIRSSQPKRHFEMLGSAALFVLGLLARLDTSLITGDMSNFYFVWYQNILDNGAAVAFREHLIGYTPAFGTFLLAPRCLTPSFPGLLP